MAAVARSQDEIFQYLLLDQPTFAESCLKIRNKAGKIIPLLMNAAQKFINDRLEDQLRRTGRVRAFVLKGRQQGASTWITGRHFRRVATEFGKKAYILTHEVKATSNLFDMVSRYYEHLPPELKPHAGSASAKSLYFDRLDSGYDVGTAGTKGTGRSGTVQFFHGSEVAHWANAADHMAGVGQSVADMDDTEIILESTANGIGNYFHGGWQNAVAGEGDYIAIFVPWFWQTEYQRDPPATFEPDSSELEYQEAFGLSLPQLYWRRLKIRDDFKGDVALFDQEYPATPEHAFMSAGPNTLILPIQVAAARKARIDVPATAIKLWGLDPAEYGDDRTALAKRQGRVISECKYWAKKGPMEVVALVAIEYEREPNPKPHAIMVDTTGGSIGSGIADRMLELNLPAVRVGFGDAAIDDEHYKLRRDEMWGDFRDWMRDRPNQLPDSDALQADITGPKFNYDSSRRMRLESKEHMKHRGLKSPDGGDACALTFAYKFAPANADMGERAPAGPNDWRTL